MTITDIPCPTAWASYRSNISIVFGLEFDFEVSI